MSPFWRRLQSFGANGFSGLCSSLGGQFFKAHQPYLKSPTIGVPNTSAQCTRIWCTVASTLINLTYTARKWYLKGTQCKPLIPSDPTTLEEDCTLWGTIKLQIELDWYCNIILNLSKTLVSVRIQWAKKMRKRIHKPDACDQSEGEAPAKCSLHTKQSCIRHKYLCQYWEHHHTYNLRQSQ